MDTTLLNAIMARKTMTPSDLLATGSNAARLAGSVSARAIGEFLSALRVNDLRQAGDVLAEARVLGEAATSALTRITAERTSNREIKVVLDLNTVFDEDADIFNHALAGVLEVQGLKSGTQSPFNPLTLRYVKAIVACYAVAAEEAEAKPTCAAIQAGAVDAITRTQLRVKVSGSDDMCIPLGAMMAGTVFVDGPSLWEDATDGPSCCHVLMPQSIYHPIQGIDILSADDALTATLSDPRQVGAFGVTWSPSVLGSPVGADIGLWGTITFLFGCEAL